MKEALMFLVSCLGRSSAFPISPLHHYYMSTRTSTHHSSKVETNAHKNAAIVAGGGKSVKTGFDSFDYESQWYPVIWAADVPLNQPVRVTLFDVHYVVWKTSQCGKNDKQEAYHALIDSCPHKKVALSEGRITTGPCGTNLLQCSYHGWAFDGESGRCVEIPQVLIAKRRLSHDAAKSTNNKVVNKARRQDAKSVAVTEAQGMIWLYPSKSPLEALLESGPPRIPELDMKVYKATVAVRDFPIDWTVLMENIMDPDHGYFAHSSSGSMAKAFDWYASDGAENRVDIDEDFTSPTGYKITSSVNAVDKLTKYNKEVRMPQMEGLRGGPRIASKAPTDDILSKILINKPKKNAPPKLATTTFIAPSVITLGRRDNKTARSQFLTGFWICPMGTGKSRFMSAAISKSHIAIPRWLVHMNLNNFLDQDTYLLVGQNRAVLKKEAEEYLAGDSGKDSNVRTSTYVYKSPSEKMGVRVGRFFDATLSRVPNRKEALMSWYQCNIKSNILFEEWPSREVVLDRYRQHTAICPDSMDVVKNCDKVMETTKFFGAAVIVKKLMCEGISFPILQTFQKSVPLPTAIRAAKPFLRQIVTRVMNFRIVQSLMTNKAINAALVLASLLYWTASGIKREFFFKFDDAVHRADIKFISKNWVDL